jgi:hypothetical protein
MTRLSTRIIRHAGLTLAFALSLSALSTSSNISRITACMIRQRTNLSSGCRTVLERDLAAQQASKVAAK